MKSLFKSKPRTPAELVRHTRDLLVFFDRDAEDARESKREEKLTELSKLIQDLELILSGNSETESVPENRVLLTQEFFQEDTFRLLLVCLLKLNLEGLFTRHKSTLAKLLSKKYDWFFAEYNSKLLESSNYFTRRLAIKLLGDMLLDRSNAIVMTRYVSSHDNLRSILYCSLRNLYFFMQESSKSIQKAAFYVFKLFAANPNKPSDIVNILVANKTKLVRSLADLSTDKEDEEFDVGNAQIMAEIASLEP